MKKIDDSRPPAQNLAVIYLLFARRLRFDFQKQLEEVEAQDFMAVAEAALSMCGGGVGGDEAAAFWIAKQFYGKIKRYVSLIYFLYRDLIGHNRTFSQPEGTCQRLVQMGHDAMAKGAGTSKLYA